MGNGMDFRKADGPDIEWFHAKTSYMPGPGFLGIVAVRDGERRGVMGLDYWTPKSVQLHIAVEGTDALPPLWQETTRFLKSVGREVVYGVTPSDRSESIALQKACGFHEAYRMKDGWDSGIDMVLAEKRL